MGMSHEGEFMRYHFNPETGRTGKCDATVRPCRFQQTEEEHGSTPAEARANYERTMESELLPVEASAPVDASADEPVELEIGRASCRERV